MNNFVGKVSTSTNDKIPENLKTEPRYQVSVRCALRSSWCILFWPCRRADLHLQVRQAKLRLDDSSRLAAGTVMQNGIPGPSSSRIVLSRSTPIFVKDLALFLCCAVGLYGACRGYPPPATGSRAAAHSSLRYRYVYCCGDGTNSHWRLILRSSQQLLLS